MKLIVDEQEWCMDAMGQMTDRHEDGLLLCDDQAYAVCEALGWAVDMIDPPVNYEQDRERFDTVLTDNNGLFLTRHGDWSHDFYYAIMFS